MADSSRDDGTTKKCTTRENSESAVTAALTGLIRISGAYKSVARAMTKTPDRPRQKAALDALRQLIRLDITPRRDDLAEGPDSKSRLSLFRFGRPVLPKGKGSDG